MAKKKQISAPVDRVERWPLSRLTPYAQNPRTHSEKQVAQIAASMKAFGQAQLVVVDERGEIVAGHGRVLGAEKLGWKQVIVGVAVGWSEAQKRAYRIADNQIGLTSSWDAGLLRIELSDLKIGGFDLPLIGFDDSELQSLLGVTPESDDEEIPPVPANPVTRPGDVWICGQHRIICGDCRDASVIDRVLSGAKINVAVTSPPYAEQRDYDEASGFRPVPPDEYVEWFKPVSSNIADHLAVDGSWFINIKPNADGLDTSLYVFDLVIAHVREWRWHFATEFCWERNGVPKSVTRRFKNQFEPIYQFSRGNWKMRPDAVMHASLNVPIPGGPGVGDTSWKTAQGGNGPMFGGQKRGRLGVGPTTNRKRGFPTGEDRQGTNWQRGAPLGIPRNEIAEGMAYPGNRLPPMMASHEALGHAAAFPVGLPAFFIKAFSDANDVVLDPFVGSGSSMMAADQNGRRFCGVELSTSYVDVTIERWMSKSGADAVLESTGKSYKQMRGQRAPAIKRAAVISAGDIHRSLSEPRAPKFGVKVGMRRAKKKGRQRGGPSVV